MRWILIGCAVIAVTISGVWRGWADPSYRRNVPEKLARQAYISEISAVDTAQREVPDGIVIALELEREKHVLMYSIDLKVPGTEGVTEVEIDATDGTIIATEHEKESG